MILGSPSAWSWAPRSGEIRPPASHEALVLGEDRQGQTVYDVELLVDVVQVDLDGAFLHEDPLGDRLVAEPYGHQPKDVELTHGEVLGELTCRHLPLEQLLEQAAGRALFHPAFPGVHLPHAIDE